MSAQFTPQTYELDPKPENNWLFAAFRGFQNLRILEPTRQIRTFATIGTGPGLDAIGAHMILDPEHVIATDIVDAIVDVARGNILRHIPSKTQVTTLTGDLCAPLRKAQLTADLMYANLPLLPMTAETADHAMASSTFVSDQAFHRAPEVYRHWRLAMMYVFLHDARSSLSPGGSVAINIGGRVPDVLLRQLFTECRYSYRELFTMLKIQSQPEQVLPGFTKAERDHRVQFDFYSMKEPSAKRICATEALRRHQKGEVIGHTVKMIEGTPIVEGLR